MAAKGISLLLGFGAPKGAPKGAPRDADDDPADDDDDGEDDAKRSAAEDIIDAVGRRDADALVAAFERLAGMCA